MHYLRHLQYQFGFVFILLAILARVLHLLMSPVSLLPFEGVLLQCLHNDYPLVLVCNEDAAVQRL